MRSLLTRHWFRSIVGAIVFAVLVIVLIEGLPHDLIRTKLDTSFDLRESRVSIGISAFLLAFGVSMYLDPDYWAFRMGLTALAAFVASPFAGGWVIEIPTTSGFVKTTTPEPHWSFYVVLACLVMFFGVLHFLERRRVTANKPPRNTGAAQTTANLSR